MHRAKNKSRKSNIKKQSEDKIIRAIKDRIIRGISIENSINNSNERYFF